jgi:hypothetical protein
MTPTKKHKNPASYEGVEKFKKDQYRYWVLPRRERKQYAWISPYFVYD